MIIIDEHANNNLIKTLESLRSEYENYTYKLIHFKFSKLFEMKDNKRVHKEAITSIEKYTPAPNAALQVFLCEDGDLFILISKISGRDARILIFDIAKRTNIEKISEFTELHELLTANINKLLLALEQESEKQRLLLEDTQKQRNTQQAVDKRDKILNGYLPAHRIENLAIRRESRPSPELMIIEDDAFSRRLVGNVLKQFSLTGLGSAELALANYVHIAPDILFLDINLPDVSGHELLEKITALDPKAYVVMLSANADIENITQALSKGAKGFVAKPFSRDKLFEYIERCPTIRH